MILEAVEVVERRAAGGIVSTTASAVGMEVPLKRHGAHGEAGGIGGAMEVAHGVEAPVLMVHEPVERMGGAMGAGEAIGAGELRPFAAEFEDHQPDHAFWQVRCGPLAQT